ncbi:MAG: pentapeptide repeat-containing protein [Thiotrichales bacterium]|nr:pentapeptide repeat-containing protein [Thiotrichales bacterium]
MHNTSLWYLRRGDRVTGPFPARVISDYLILGRIRDDDLISRDKTAWQAVAEHRELYPEVLLQQPVDKELLQKERLRVDERFQQRRAEGKNRMASERRKARDRRMEEDPDLVQYRLQRALVMDSLKDSQTPRKRYQVTAYILIITLVLVTGAYTLNPGQLDNSVQCNTAPRPGIDLSHCRLKGVDLSNADLSGALLKDARLEQAILLGTKLFKSEMDFAVVYKGNLGFADLSHASLKGVDFRHADLSYVNFEHADLSYADLSGAVIGGADFSNARLDNAIWVDQKTCLRGSIGVCRLN